MWATDVLDLHVSDEVLIIVGAVAYVHQSMTEIWMANKFPCPQQIQVNHAFHTV